MKNAKNTTKKATEKATNAPVYVTLTHEGKATIVAEILAHVHTCKEASAYFADLADKFGKDQAKEILASVKASVKERVGLLARDAKDCTDYLKDGYKVAKNAWDGLIREMDAQGRQWARLVYESANCDLVKMVVRFADVVSELADRSIVVARRCSRKDAATGEYVSGYAPMRNTPSAWLCALKTAVKNAKKQALGKAFQEAVDLTWDE